MINSNLLRALYGGTTSVIDFCYDTLVGPPLLSLMHPYDIEQLRQIATSIELAGNIDKKYQIIDSIMKYRNFKRLAAGTNRLVYTHMEHPYIVVKVAVDEVGLKDNPAEFINQKYIKPFCCKVFEVSPCGTVATFERVERITSRYEFATIADDIFDMIVNKLVGKYILEDIGTNFMYNWGIRKGFGPVLLDFPYVYELDGAKIFCNSILDNGCICGGEIDYDPGFNFLSCKRCGKPYNARDLSKPSKQSGLFIQARKKGVMKMKVACVRGENTVVKEKDYKDLTQYMKKPKKVVRPEKKISDPSKINNMPVVIGVYGNKKKSELDSEFEKAVENRKQMADERTRKYGKFCGVRVSEDAVETPNGIVDPFAGIVKVTEKPEEHKKEDVIPEQKIDPTNIGNDEEDVAVENSVCMDELRNNELTNKLMKSLEFPEKYLGDVCIDKEYKENSELPPIIPGSGNVVHVVSFADDEDDVSDNTTNDEIAVDKEDTETVNNKNDISIEAVLPEEKPTRHSRPKSKRYNADFYKSYRRK